MATPALYAFPLQTLWSCLRQELSHPCHPLSDSQTTSRVICGNRLFGGEWLEVHKRRIYCIRKIIEFYDNVTLPSTQLGIGGKGKIREN